MNIEFNNKGIPGMALGSKAIIAFVNPDEVPNVNTNTVIEAEAVGNKKFIPWFDGNSFPETAIEIIGSLPVLTEAVKMNTKITAGQGIIPVRILNQSLDGNDEIEIINEPELNALLQRHMIRRYIAKCGYDLNSLANSFVKLIPNLAGNKILRIVPINARHCRLSEPKNGQIEKVYTHGNWADAEAKDIKEYVLLDENDPLAHLEELKTTGGLKAPVVMQLKSDFTTNDFYAVPEWYAAKKWIDIAQKVAKAIDAGMDNMLNIYIHVKIPYSYWEKKYPLDQFDNKVEERTKKIQADLDAIEEKLTSAENAKKTLITMFGDADQGEDKWELEVIEKKYSQEDFVKSTAADTQIAIAAGINPDLLGLMFGNSKGGSMQRELLLIKYALSWLDRQKLADPIELMLQFNDAKYADIQIMFRNTFLTTLDSGSGTQTNAS